MTRQHRRRSLSGALLTLVDRAEAAQDAAGLEDQLRELRRAVKYASTFEEKDAILAALVPDDGKLATVYPDRIKLCACCR